MITLRINGRAHRVDVDPDTPLLWVLRDTLDLLGTKFGCGAGLCGACTVHYNGEAVRACQMPASEAAEGEIVTIEGLAVDPLGRSVQAAWAELDVAQCGYCQPGQIMSATALLRSEADPDAEQIDAAMSGNICRCGTYNRIRAAIRAASGRVKGEGE